jgi:hypothetical protein
MKFKIYNPDLSTEERTYLDADYSSGTTLTVRNNDGFTANYFAVVGEPGQEQTEAVRISSTTGSTTITIASALNFAHPKSTPVYLSRWDKWSVESKATSGGTFAAISGSPFSIGWDDKDLTTTITDDAGSTSYYYRWRPYSSGAATYGTYSDTLAGTGLGRTTVGYLIEQVRKSPLSKEMDDGTIIDYFNEYQDLVYERIPNGWWFTKIGTAVATAASDYDYSVSTNWSDFLSMEYMLYRYIHGDTDITYPLTWSPPAEFYNLKSDANDSNDDYVKWWTLLPPDSGSAKGYIGLHPTPKTDDCYLKPVYNFELTDLDSFGDTIVIPKPKGYVDYALYRISDDIKLDETNANKYLARVEGSIVALKRRKRRQLGQPELMRFRGHRGWSQLFGEQTRLNSSEARELYW